MPLFNGVVVFIFKQCNKLTFFASRSAVLFVLVINLRTWSYLLLLKLNDLLMLKDHYDDSRFQPHVSYNTKTIILSPFRTYYFESFHREPLKQINENDWKDLIVEQN